MNGEKKDSEPLHPRSLTEIKVKEVMNRRPRTINPDTSIEGLVERLLGQVEGCFPVVDRDRKLLGIVTESDLLQVLQVPLRGATVGHAMMKEVMKRSANKVEEIMTKRPITATAEMTIQETLNLMAAHKLRHLPVVENEKVIGLICLRDILQFYHMLR